MKKSILVKALCIIEKDDKNCWPVRGMIALKKKPSFV
jgi:hypothetical protein